MVARLNRRDQFAHLRAHCNAVREGPLRVSFVDPDARIGPSGAAVAFAVPRRFGSAVRRNRLRRRLRAIIAEFADNGELPGLWFLVSVMNCTTEPRYDDLSRWIGKALERISEHPSQLGPLQSDASPSPGPQQ